MNDDFNNSKGYRFPEELRLQEATVSGSPWRINKQDILFDK